MPETASLFNRQILSRIFFFAVFLFLLYQLLQILSPFFSAIMGAVTLTLIFYPLHHRVNRHLTNNANVSAALCTVAILVIVILPVILFVWILVREASVVYPAAQEWVQTAKSDSEESLAASLPTPLKNLWTRAEQFLVSWDIDPQDVLLKNLDQAGRKISAFGTKIVKNFVFIIFNLLVMGFSMFFFFRDGARMMRWIIDLIPMEPVHKDLVLHRLDRTLSAVVRGVFITATVQGVLAGIGFAILGIKFPVLLSFATAFLAMIPFVGAAGIWIPVSAYLLIKGTFWKGVVLALWGFLVVSMVDNFLRPILIGEKAKLPIFLLFFGILGGLQVYGFIGILIGPLMIASVMAFAKIYREQFQRPMPEPGAESSPLPPPPLKS